MKFSGKVDMRKHVPVRNILSSAILALCHLSACGLGHEVAVELRMQAKRELPISSTSHQSDKLHIGPTSHEV